MFLSSFKYLEKKLAVSLLICESVLLKRKQTDHLGI